MFEKYDGVRGFWNPKKKSFFSRTGKRFPFPQDIVNAMPTDTFLDGELWYLIIQFMFLKLLAFL
jgi:ATP-dependent DNA ligase